MRAKIAKTLAQILLGAMIFGAPFVFAGKCNQPSHDNHLEDLLPFISSQPFVNSCNLGGFCHDYYGTGTSAAACGSGYSTLRCTCDAAVGTCVMSNRTENIIYYSTKYTAASVEAQCVTPNVFSSSCLP